jgi:hypothetical protein
MSPVGIPGGTAGILQALVQTRPVVWKDLSPCWFLDLGALPAMQRHHVACSMPRALHANRKAVPGWHSQ